MKRSGKWLYTAGPSLLILALAGCTDDIAKHQKHKSRGTAGTSSTASELSPEEQAQVLARVGAVTITLADFERRINDLNPFARGRYDGVNRKRELLESMIRLELLALEAQAQGYDADREVQMARKQALVKQLQAKKIRNLVRTSDITDAEIEGYYADNPDKFRRPAQVRAAHLLLADEGEARALLAEIRQEIAGDKRKARDLFADFVRRRSKDEATRENGGDLQFFGKPGVSRVERGPMAPPIPPPVALAAFKLAAVGNVSPEPIKSSQGWHIVQKTGFRQPVDRKLEEVKTSIRNKLFRTKKSKAMEDYVVNLRAKARIEIDEAVLAKAKAPTTGRRPGPGFSPAALTPPIPRSGRQAKPLGLPDQPPPVPGLPRHGLGPKPKRPPLQPRLRAPRPPRARQDEP